MSTVEVYTREIMSEPLEAHVLLDKICSLGPHEMAEVEDFVDFLRQRREERQLTQAASAASEQTFARVWDNDEDAVYDDL